MNILSFASITIAILYIILLIKQVPNCKGDLLVKFSMIVFATLAWWNFCDAFFYEAATEAEAWYWLHIGALGWCGFIPTTAFYFIIMAENLKHWKGIGKQLLFWVPAISAIILFMTPKSYAIADRLVQSTSGLGWTYKQSFTTVWPYLIFLMAIVYMGGALYRVYRWQKTTDKEGVKSLTKGFIVLDIISLFVGILLIYGVPLVSNYLPPMNFIPTGIFLFGYWNELTEHDLMHIEMAINPNTVFENSLDSVLITDINWRILYANDAAKELLSDNSIKGKDFLRYLDLEEVDLLLEFIASKTQRKGGLEFSLKSQIPVVCSVSKTMTKKMGHEVYVLSMQDISGLRNAQEKLKYLAHYDELTGLPNRRRLGELLDQWEQKYAKGNEDFAILFMDLNRFKSINDNYGHEAGDKVLQWVATSIESAVPIGDIATRLAGDEFVILHAPGSEKIETVIQSIQNELDQIDCSSFDANVNITASVGICWYSEAGCVRELFKLADQRMYEIKNTEYMKK